MTVSPRAVTAPWRRPPRPPRATTIIGCGLICLLLSAAAIIVAATAVLQRDAEQRVAVQADRNIRIAWRILGAFGGSFRIEDGHLYDGTTRLDGNLAVVDDIQALVGGVATIFRGDERVATNILEPDGRRALGTHLAASDVRVAVFDRHRPYRGKVDILGAPYASAYDPITDADGHVIGVLFVGTSEAETLAGIATVRRVLVAVSVVAFALVGLLFFVVGRRIARQLGAREAALSAVNARLDTALESMGQGLCFFGGDGRLVMASRRFTEMYGLPPDAIPPGTTLKHLVELRYAAGSSPKMTSAEYLSWRRDVAASATAVDTVVNLQDGRVIAIHHQPLPDGGWVATHDDITHRRRIEDEALFMARHDALTRLGNRVLFRECLERANQSNVVCAVICLDLDRFKEVNDTLGHPVGDMLLQAVAGRLLHGVRTSDSVIRLGGDEFAIIYTPWADQAETTTLAERLIATVSEPYQLVGQQVVIGTSVGIALGSATNNDPDGLLRQADIALYRAKAEGRGCWRVYQPEMGEHLRALRQLESDLRRALANEEFMLFYQPLVDVRTGLVSGFEALLRWPHPTRGMVMPQDFIELAESSGLIVPLGAWVLRRAAADAASWPSHLKVAVNLSTLQFGSRLVQTVCSALEYSGLQPDRLELEITETALLKNSDWVIATLHDLRGRGIKIVLDDFGIGYSSLFYLLKFPFDKIKIDKSFIQGVAEQPASAAIVRAVSGLAHSIGIEILAEGVETQVQLEWLRAEGFDEVQGHLFSAARPAAEVPQMFGDAPTAQQGQAWRAFEA